MKNRIRIISNLLLLLTALIWGAAFVAQSVGMKYVGPWTFVFSRFLIAGILLIPVVKFSKPIYESSNPSDCDVTAGNLTDSIGNMSRKKKLQKVREAVIAGISCGFFLGTASILQQIGIQYTTVGKAGFITALYVIIVPMIGLLLGKKIPGRVWAGAVLAISGFYLLCMKGSFRIEMGDALILGCAILFSFQIMCVDYFSSRCNPVMISCVQFFMASFVGLIGMLIFENINLQNILDAAAPILYAGVMSSAVGYTLQIVAQKNTDPAIASLIMSLESVFSALAGWLILHQHLSSRELYGCTLVFAAVIIAQLPLSEIFLKDKK